METRPSQGEKPALSHLHALLIKKLENCCKFWGVEGAFGAMKIKLCIM